FALLAKLAPFWYQPNQEKWKQSLSTAPMVQCPTLLPLRHMTSAAGCHMCGKCSGYKDAIHLSLRSPQKEIVQQSLKKQHSWESVLIVYGLLGLALGAFQWSVSHWLPFIKERVATWFIDNDILWPFSTNAPWWIFTNYPSQHDVFSWLDGGLVISYMIVFAIGMGSFISLLLYISTRIMGPFQMARLNHLAQSLIPLAGCTVFIGLLANTLTLLRGEHIIFTWITTAKFALLILSSVWSAYLAWKVISGYTTSFYRKVVSLIPICGIYIAVNGVWVLILFIWSLKPDAMGSGLAY
ncbi:MAG: 4Fe-4S binding protein, partial [Gammaproteobacteria bacterium]|nr:4Fe-4S binding protein [Gammaproteobacteria bacterium]